MIGRTMRLLSPRMLSILVVVAACGGDDIPTDGGATDVGVSRDGSVGDGGGRVDFVAVYEAGSAWVTNAGAQAMVESVFADFESNLRSGGAFDATVAVYLTDDNPANANVTFDRTFSLAIVEGQEVDVVSAWHVIVMDADPNGPASPDGRGTEFSVHFNVTEHGDNRGLLRHEMMHGLGAVGSSDWFTITDANVITGPVAGERQRAALYDLRIVDTTGTPLFADYDGADGTFVVQAVEVDALFVDWMDGDGGLLFRGIAGDGSIADMSLLTGPGRAGGGELRMNEITDVMTAGIHPTWDTIEEPDWSFFRAMGYRVAVD